jgi:hypothetical protein
MNSTTFTQPSSVPGMCVLTRELRPVRLACPPLPQCPSATFPKAFAAICCLSKDCIAWMMHIPIGLGHEVPARRPAEVKEKEMSTRRAGCSEDQGISSRSSPGRKTVARPQVSSIALDPSFPSFIMSSTSQSTTSFTSVHADKSGSTCYSGTTLHPSSYTSEYPDSHDIDDTASTDTSEPLDQALRDVGVWTIDAPEPEQYQAADDGMIFPPVHSRPHSH